MTSVLITDITLMTAGLCVIGLVRDENSYRSIRPLPPRGPAWTEFPYSRGSMIGFNLFLPEVHPPHLEDRWTNGVIEMTARVPEVEVVERLRKAETSETLEGLFRCQVHENPNGRMYAEPGEAARSICGCVPANLQLRWEGGPGQLRASLALASGQTLPDLKVVDHDWNDFVGKALNPGRGANLSQRLNRFLVGGFQQKVLSCSHLFVRVGLTRPMHQDRCWLMLDTVFPLPQTSWLEEF